MKRQGGEAASRILDATSCGGDFVPDSDSQIVPPLIKNMVKTGPKPVKTGQNAGEVREHKEAGWLRFDGGALTIFTGFDQF
jgi:hypothetical protein